MISTSIAFDRSARRLSTLALVGAAVLTACDNDKTVAPTHTEIPTEAASISVAKPGALIITIVDQNGNTPKTVGAQFTYSSGAAAYFLIDNGSGDSDSTANVILKKGLLGTYTVCQTAAPTDYVLANPACQTVSIPSGVTAKLQFVDKTVGLVQWRFLDFVGTPVGGAVYNFNDGSGWVSIADDSALDLDKTPGQFLVKAPGGNANVCTLTPPTGWTFGGGTCFGMPAPSGQTTFVKSWVANAEYSVIVAVGDMITWGAGPSEYVVKSAAGFSETLIDEGKNDRWTGKLGFLWMLLPTDGDYEICQTVPPPGTKLANPSCVQFTVKQGVINTGVGFISDWL